MGRALLRALTWWNSDGGLEKDEGRAVVRAPFVLLAELAQSSGKDSERIASPY